MQGNTPQIEINLKKSSKRRTFRVTLSFVRLPHRTLPIPNGFLVLTKLFTMLALAPIALLALAAGTMSTVDGLAPNSAPSTSTSAAATSDVIVAAIEVWGLLGAVAVICMVSAGLVFMRQRKGLGRKPATAAETRAEAASKLAPSGHPTLA